MKKFFLICLSISFLSACSVNCPKCEQRKECEICKKNEIDLFEKKQECQKYIQSVQDEIKERRKEREKNINYNKESLIVLEKLFYSPKEDSCLAYTIDQIIDYNDHSTVTIYELEDILESKMLEFVMTTTEHGSKEKISILSGDKYKTIEEFENELKEYQK